MHGSLQLLPSHPQVLAYVREHAGERLLCAFNLSEQSATLALAADQSIATLLSDSGASGATPQPGAIRFDPYGVLFARLA
jgi:alpha-glucosidase